MNTLTNMPNEIEPQEKESDKKVEEDKKLWPRDPLREEDEKASAETERHLWTDGEADEEQKDKKLWPRDSLREEDEKASAETERHLWTEGEKKEEQKKKE